MKKSSTSSNLFDEHGRLIPVAGDLVYSERSRRYFSLTQPALDYAGIHARIERHLGGANITAGDFAGACEAMLHGLAADEQTEGLLNGVRIPFFYPALPEGDYGTQWEKVFLPAVESSFRESFPRQKFTNHGGSLAGKVRVRPESRHGRLGEDRQGRAVVGWYFPNCLSEYALPSQRNRVASLPENLCLSGGFDAAAALVGCPGLLHKPDGYPHLLALSALETEEKGFFLHFEAYGLDLTFNKRSSAGAVSEYWAGGLTVVG